MKEKSINKSKIFYFSKSTLQTTCCITSMCYCIFPSWPGENSSFLYSGKWQAQPVSISTALNVKWGKLTSPLWQHTANGKLLEILDSFLGSFKLSFKLSKLWKTANKLAKNFGGLKNITNSNVDSACAGGVNDVYELCTI